MEHGASWIHSSLIYLAAAVAAVPLSRLLGLGSIIGYLAAGIAIGPWGLKLVSDPQTMLHVAEFGVVLMLFQVGLELEPRRLWALRRPIFGWGTLQYVGSATLLAAVGLAAGIEPRLAVVAALGLAMSSTAIGLSVLNERNLMATPSGQSVLSVMLLQDIAAIPVLALIPLLAASGTAGGDGGWRHALLAVAVIVAIVFGGRLLLRPALRWIARSDTPEIFTAASLLLVVATAALMQAVGLSMALGAFLAGVLLAESEFRTQLETDLEPFKGLLLGLFFIAVGMGIDFDVVLQHPGVVAALVVAFLAVKALVLVAMAVRMQLPLAERPVFTLLLAQGGEFGFVVFQGAAGSGVMDAPTASLLVAAVALSMLLTPLLLVAAGRWQTRHAAGPVLPDGLPQLTEPQHAPVIIAGFGRYGQIVGRLLSANGLSATVLDHSVEQVESVRRFGWPAFYGDATRLDLLRTAGAEKARVFVVAIDDVDQSVACARLVREHFPQLTLVARARNVTHYYRLRELGVTMIERETLDSALMSARTVLESLGVHPLDAQASAERFRAHSIELVEQMAPHWSDERRLIAIAKQGRQQFEQLWAREKAERAERAGSSAPRIPDQLQPGQQQPQVEQPVEQRR